jgi:hypothetical protein
MRAVGIHQVMLEHRSVTVRFDLVAHTGLPTNCGHTLYVANVWNENVVIGWGSVSPLILKALCFIRIPLDEYTAIARHGRARKRQHSGR